MEILEELKSHEYFSGYVIACFIIMNLIGYGTVWANTLYRKKYKKQIHWIVFVILNFLGCFFGVVFGAEKFKYNKGYGIIAFTALLAMLGYFIFCVNYLI